ncbi:MAG: hypothetical protein MRK02_11180 [Candidatus Scalindua sp.]|nr:hypothetical protein [Candidatus Scalindua sp.]
MRRTRLTQSMMRMQKYRRTFGWLSACTFAISIIMLVVALLDCKFRSTTDSFIYVIWFIALLTSLVSLLGFVSMVIIARRQK